MVLHKEMDEMFTSLRIHRLRWQIKALLRKRQLENRRPHNGRHLFLG